MSLSEIITQLHICFGFFEKKGCTPTRVLFIFLTKSAYMLQATFPCHHHDGYQNKQTRAWLLCYKLYIKKRWWRDEEKSESGLTSYIVLLNVQGFVRWYKGNFPGAFFILNNGLFLFFPGFFWFFFRGEDIFSLDNYRTRVKHR